MKMHCHSLHSNCFTSVFKKGGSTQGSGHFKMSVSRSAWPSRRVHSVSGLQPDDFTPPPPPTPDASSQPSVRVQQGKYRQWKSIDRSLPPIDAANVFSSLLFNWISPLINLGNKHALEQSDLPAIGKRDEAAGLCRDLEREWLRQKRKKNPSLVLACFSVVGRSFFFHYSVSFGTNLVAAFIQPIFIGQMIQYFSGEVSRRDAYLYTTGFILLSIIRAFVYHFCYFSGSRELGMQLRVALSALIHKRVLRLSQSAILRITTGHIINLVSTDVQRLDEASSWFGSIAFSLAATIAAIGLVWREIGPSCLAGFGLVLPLFLLQFLSLRLMSRIRDRTAKETDKRVRLMNEIITGMQLIKMYTWEKPFHKIISAVRKLELTLFFKRQILLGFNTAISEVGLQVIAFVSFAVYVYTGHELTPRKAFVTISLLQVFRTYVLLLALVAANLTSESWVAIRRIQDFLEFAEENEVWPVETGKQQPVVEAANDLDMFSTDTIDQDTTTRCAVEMTDFSASWGKVNDGDSDGVFSLEDLTLTAKMGDLLMVVGATGAGKTSFLMALLGELRTLKGGCRVQGQIGYASQLAWVFSGTIQENILFRRPYDAEWYGSVVAACCLDKDIQNMSHGDLTLVGERGVKLSGGQKARIGLARALYQDADVYLLDDPLSAVDPEVGRLIFDRCILGLLKDKAVALVTHQLQFLPHADNILVLSKGRALGVHTYDRLMQSGLDITTNLVPKEDGDQERQEEKSKIENSDLYIGESNAEQEEAEDRDFGSVKLSRYWRYFRAGVRSPTLVLIILYCFVTQACSHAADWWLAFWTTRSNDTTPVLNCSSPANCTVLGENLTYPRDMFFSIYGGLVALLVVLVLIRSVLIRLVFLFASEGLHQKMLSSILKAPILFFDTNPSGRILNRFAKDINLLDVFMPFVFYEGWVWGIALIGVVVVSAIANPWAVIALLPIFTLAFYFRHRYLKSSREIKRLEAIARSPVFSQFSASLQGLTTIRAAHAEEQLQEKFHQHLDDHSQGWLCYLGASRWLASRLELTACIYAIFFVYSALLVFDYGLNDNLNLDAGTLGLSVTYTMALFGYLNWVVKSTADVENLMTSVERIFSYIGLEAEKETKHPIEPSEDWPQHGGITGENVTFRYSDDGAAVLSDLQFNILPGEKVGIVGRTGAGKSSFINALFRLAPTEGNLSIDGVPLDDLLLVTRRKKLSIIPQDPVLYSGSLRYNLDPFGRSSDEDLWSALHLVQLRDYVSQLDGGLSSELAENGANFSVGQRQLLCLARALLNHNRILLIDEATANVDNQTDAIIQQTLRTHFADCTVMTIAHRLNTIMDSDRIMVIDKGRMVEFASPADLLRDPDSAYSGMLAALGDEEAGYWRNQVLRRKVD